MDSSARAGVAANRDLWERWTPHHLVSEFYDVEGFAEDPASRPLDSIVCDVIGDVAGARVLHLQCHFGLDTIRLALAGASVVGVDLSSEGIRAARELAARLGVSAEFVESDVRDLRPETVSAGDGFDVVFTSYGVISWLPDLRPWAATIARCLAPGGRFCMVEMHPTLWLYDEEAPDPPLPLRYSYFSHEPLVLKELGSYAAPDSGVEGTSYSWQHDFEEIVGSLLAEGLVIESLREYPKIHWRHVPYMVQDDDGFWRLPPEAGDVPLMFSLVARKPASG